jgi:WhiB family transcriptional regulator, redox-sensing transcriptional regulator
MLEFSPDWRADSACRNADPDLFFPVAAGTVASKQIATAQQICAGCLVKKQCLEFAMRTHEAAGIWGGTTPEERIRARRAVRARQRRTPSAPMLELPETRAS